MSVRRPAVAGQFYPSDPHELRESVVEFLGAAVTRRTAFGAIVPHAGYVYSGRVAGAVYARIEVPEQVIILCPNHTGLGAPAALSAHDAWATPLGEVPCDARLRARLLELCPSLEEDDRAHRQEHSLEVQLPFLQLLQPRLTLTAICLGALSLPLCREVGSALARVRSEAPEPILLLASSDMNHYESRAAGNRKNAMALAKIRALDAPGLFETVLAHDISMCGVLPATALLYAALASGVSRVEVAASADSGDVTGDVGSVVGYAGIVFD